MSERRHTSAAVVIGLLFAAIPLTVYVGGYFALSERHSGATSDDFCRIFPTPWLASIYKPAAKVESALTGDAVSTYCSSPAR